MPHDLHIIIFAHSICRVDGLLFINLSEEEWPDMGIANKFHTRKLQLILKAYRVRYQRRKDKIEIGKFKFGVFVSLGTSR